MATETTNIDDLLTQGNSSLTPPTPESKNLGSDDNFPDDYSGSEQNSESYDDNVKNLEDSKDSEEEREDDHRKEVKEENDEYGNSKPKPRTYTEDEVNERINKAVRERLSRGNNQNQGSINQQSQEQSKNFEYNPESSETWESQLESFVEKTISKLSHKQYQQVQLEKEANQQAEFEEKFNRGMSKFNDFRDIVGSQPMTDAMTYALRGLNDPASFIYAASKRFPQELERISKISDPVAQVMEMGGLERSMRKASQTTKAPKPVSRSKEDSSMPITNKKKEPSIEDLIAASEAKKRSQLQQKRNR